MLKKNQRGRFFIQIPIKIFTLLWIYSEKVQAGNYDFPDFSEKCPICGNPDCAVRIGYYYRWAVDIDYDTLKIVVLEIPVARYKCNTAPKGKCRTFSLLPDNLIPYNQYSIDFVLYILTLYILKNQTTRETLDQIDLISPYACLVSEKILSHIISILERTRIKLLHFFQLFPDSNKSPPEFISFTLKDTLKYLNDYPQKDTEPLYCGAYYLSAHYYEKNGSYQKNARFLFGTASQFCTKPIK